MTEMRGRMTKREAEQQEGLTKKEAEQQEGNIKSFDSNGKTWYTK